MFRKFLTGVAMSVALGSGGLAMAQNIEAADPATQTQTPGQAQTSPDQAGAATNAASQVSAIINSEFPTYDADGSGDLNKAEFGKWMLALKQQEMQATGTVLSPEELTKWADAAFGTADADKNGVVSKEELTRYLGG